MSTNQSIHYLQEMAIFVKVVETGSFSETARQMGATPSAISRAISRLEKVLGTRLLQRTTRKLRLSESGQQIYVNCLDMVNAAQAVMESSGQFHSEPQGTVRMSVPKAVGHFMLHPHMPEFFQRYPKIDVQMLLEDRYVDFIDDGVDLAIRITDHPPGGLMGRRLIEINHLLCATPQYLAEHGTPGQPQDLKQHSCIYLGEQPSDSKWKFQQGSKTITVQVSGRYSANHTGIRLDAALKHIGIASLPYFVARHALQDGRLIQVLPDWYFKTYYSGDAWLLYPPTRHLPPKLSVFIQFLAEKLALEPTL
ncbi:LysR family transcriptional regulator [Acinetobacter soli]|jgi:DNA-binding transcriptional LysR family regulator|uniref:Transcriptional regulator n=1 Tax=Acinetobacter soli TaxID=487316 RepID=A0A1P8EEN1_9GAMM|nr:LysR family transcriptional regulator [Acinetobacter soli]APV34665.1 transcriptional regulator [Acinetobacter soli]WEH91105.1 LysR family transcriptional regulator [Acinetobacter soli]WEH97479.1 LysR family transcriptional regulator [Acinetobacter soli]WEH99609.1 LysR family transcriptional regulator [Acinetobacter soli]